MNLPCGDKWAEKFVQQGADGLWRAYDETGAFEINESVRFETKAEAMAAVLQYAEDMI